MNYYDLPERERAKLTEEQLASYLPHAMMEAGVLPPTPLRLVNEPELPEFTRSKWFFVDGFSDIVFPNREAAEAFAKLRPQKKSWDWTLDDRLYYAEPDDDHSYGVGSIDLCTKDEIIGHRTLIKERKAAKDANRKERERFEKENKAASDVHSHMIEDWLRCQADDARHARTRDRWAEYVQLAGNEETARRFLEKVVSAEEIREAFTWAGESVPAVFAKDAGDQMMMDPS